MFNVLIDTSVWLDLADKPQQTPLLDPIEGLLSYAGINLLVPQIVSDEFKRNRNRIAEKSTKGLATHFNLVKDAIRRSTGNKAQKAKVLQYLSDVDHKLPQVGGNAKLALDRIEKILDAMPKIPISEAAKVKAADRALNRLGPCHNNKNAMADALLIETYFECVRAGKKGDRFAFVTHNKIDFSLAGGDEKLPHKRPRRRVQQDQELVLHEPGRVPESYRTSLRARRADRTFVRGRAPRPVGDLVLDGPTYYSGLAQPEHEHAVGA